MGTDVSGGYGVSILNAIQNASVASKIISIQSRDNLDSGSIAGSGFTNKPLPIPTLLYLATAGGARVCGLENQVGDFKEGKAFDALLVSVREEVGNPGVWDVQSNTPFEVGVDEKKLLEAQLERFLFCGDDRNISRVYVQGRWIGGNSFHRQRAMGTLN